MADRVARQKQFKNTGRHEEMRRRRAEGSLELRKQRKDEQMMKRRNVDEGEFSTEDEGTDGVKTTQASAPLQILPPAECLKILKGNPDEEQAFKAVESTRRLLSRQNNPPIDDVINLGLVPYLVSALYTQSTKIQFEAAWALTNITSGNSQQTMTVVKEGAIEPLVTLLASNDNQLAEQATWALGNITGESAHLRDIVIEAGLVDRLIALVKRPNLTIDCIRTIAWTMSNLCRYKTPNSVEFLVVQKLVPTLATLVYHPDTNVVSDVCWALGYISDGTEDRIDLVLKSGVMERVVQLASSTDWSLVSPALRCLGNIVTGDDVQTQAVLDLGVLQTVLPNALTSSKPSLTREACWMLSNICAGNSVQIQAVFDSGLLPQVIHLLKTGEYRTQLEATWVLFNICSGGSQEQIYALLQLGALPALCNLLKAKEARLLMITLDTLSALLKVADQANEMDTATLMIEECGGLDVLELLQNHENEEVYKKSLALVEKYFSDGEVEIGQEQTGDDDAAINFVPPDVENMGQFNF